MLGKFLVRGLLGLVALFPWVWLDINSVEAWHTYPELWEPRYYLVNVLLFFCLAFEGLIFAFLLRRRRWLSRLLIVLASFPFLLALTDIYVLVGCFQTSGPGGIQCLSHRNWHRRFVTSTNELGYWEDPVKMTDSPKIAAIGDSFTWGQGVFGKNLRFTEQLSSKLGHRVWNFGMNGTTTRDQRQVILPQLAPFKPDIVLVCYLANDIHDEVQLFVPRTYPREFWPHRFMVGSPTYNFIYWRFLTQMGMQEQTSQYFLTLFLNYLDPQVMAHHTQDIGQLVQDIRKMGAKPVGVLLPFPHLFRQIQPSHRDRIYGQVRKAFEDSGAPVIELQDLEHQYPPGKFEVSPIDAHPNAQVHEAIASGIARWFEAHPELLKP